MLSKHTRSSKQKTPLTIGKITSYVAVFLLIVSVIAVGYQKPQPIDQLNQTATVPGAATVKTTDDDKAPSVDQVVANDVAAGLTEQTDLPLAPTIANTSVSLAAKSELAQTSDTVISKPQIVQPTSGSRAIRHYTTKSGDTVEKVAKNYNVSENTVRWANNLTSDALSKGKKLTILPVDGVQYTVRDGDSVKALAKRFKTSEARIISYNDLELSKPRKGQKLVIPDGILPASQQPGYEAPTEPGMNTPSGSGMAIDSSIASASAGNKYAPGWCTWYAYERRVQLGLPVGSFWGNASSWASYASAAGLRVDNNPEAGAIFQTGAGGYGHVGIIESVDTKKGTVTFTDMNGIAGWGAVGRDTISISEARAQWQFIH